MIHTINDSSVSDNELKKFNCEETLASPIAAKAKKDVKKQPVRRRGFYFFSNQLQVLLHNTID